MTAAIKRRLGRLAIVVEQLKPCPFCGESGKDSECPSPQYDKRLHAWVYEWVTRIQCPYCGASAGWAPTFKRAAALWNRRAPASKGRAGGRKK